MTLNSYLSNHKITQADFAAIVNLTQGTVSKLCGRSIRPSLEIAIAIEQATNGAVPANSWVDTPPALNKPQTEASDKGAVRL